MRAISIFFRYFICFGAIFLVVPLTILPNSENYFSIQDFHRISFESPEFSAQSFDAIKSMMGLDPLYAFQPKKNISVAVLDTGINLSHPIFSNFEINKSFFWEDIRFFTEGIGSPFPIDIDGHGTHISSIIVRLTQNQNLSLVSINVFSNLSGQASTNLQNLTFAIEYTTGFSDQRRPDIISLSLGSSATYRLYDTASKAIDNCQERDIIAVCAAGNSGAWGKGSIYTPGISNWSITVGGIENADKRDSKSSIGPVFNGRIKPDLVAPSVDVEGADSKRTGLKTISGTSQAAAIISGVVSLLRGRYPHLHSADLKQILYMCSIKLPISESGGEIAYPDNFQGYGLPQADIVVSLMENNESVIFPQKIVLNSSLGRGTGWVRRVQLEKGKIYGWSLKTNDPSPNLKMILYSAESDAFGYPKILRTSEDLTNSLYFASEQDQMAYIAIKTDLRSPNSQNVIEIFEIDANRTYLYERVVYLFVIGLYLIGFFVLVRKRLS